MRKILYFIWVIIILTSLHLIYKFTLVYYEVDYINVLAQSSSTIFKYINEEDEGNSILLNNTLGRYNLYAYANNIGEDISNEEENNFTPYYSEELNVLNILPINEEKNKEKFYNSELEINYLHGDLFIENDEKNVDIDNLDAIPVLKSFDGVKFTRKELNDFNFLIRNFYIVDETTVATKELFDAKKLLAKDMTIKQNNNKPQILIYHTHSCETYINSRENNENDTVVGVGKVLKKVLEEEYGYNVIHDRTKYDLQNGYLDRNKAYNYAEKGVSKILEDNPSIEVIIDLHRDAKKKRSTFINGKEYAQIMLFNGLSRDKKGPITYLDNPNLSDNLAFSLQLQLKSLEKYPGLFYKNFLKYLRFNLHLRPKAILVELGTENNTIESAKNSMEPLAEILNDVLKGE